MFSSEIYKPEQATAQQRSATKSYQMGCEFHPYIIMTRLSSVPLPLAVFDELMSFNHILGQKMMQVLFAGSLIKNNKAIHEALMTAMSKKGTVLECIEAIEKA